jgi:hypothetical protein
MGVVGQEAIERISGILFESRLKWTPSDREEKGGVDPNVWTEKRRR